MGRITHLTRRGAVYDWRARVPLRIGTEAFSRHRWLSLRTREFRTARRAAVRITADVEEAMGAQEFVTEHQLGTIAAAALSSHTGALVRHAALMRFDRNYDREREAADGHVFALAFDMLAAFGCERTPTFDGDCPVRKRLERLGQPGETVDAVASIYEMARAAALFDANHGATQHLTDEGVADTPGNRAMAYDMLVRARGGLAATSGVTVRN